MKKFKFLGLLTVFFALFFLAESQVADVGAFTFSTECQAPLTNFSDGSFTFDVSFPPGGGITCETIAECPTVRVPDGSTIFSMKVDMELTDPASEIGTPYIWISNSGSNTLVQLRTSDGTKVKLYRNGVDGFPASAFSNPSRTTVMPKGDVYVANRGNQFVTRLTPQPSPSEEYNYGGQLSLGAGENFVRAVTFDRVGNIWAGTCYSVSGLDRLKVFCGNVSSCGANPIGTELTSLSNGKCNYGMIGDGHGFVWSVGQNVLTSYRYSAGSIIQVDTDTVNNSYGLGIDNDANIWIGRWIGNGSAFKVTRNLAGQIVSIDNHPGVAVGVGRGIAGDKDNNNWLVINDDSASWSTGSSRVIKYSSAGALLGNFPTGTGSTGVAVDFDNNIWVVNYGGGGPNFIDPNPPATCTGNGTVTKLRPNGTVMATYPTCGNNPYNYSDMTGLRTVPKTITVGSAETTIPISETGTFEICSDPSAPPLCSDSSDCDSFFFPTNCGSPGGFCEIPLEIFSMQAGDYTLKNLEVVYAEQVPITTGGLVPCGRDWNDDATDWDDTEACTPCYLIPLASNIIGFLLQIVSVLAILFIVIGGMLYASSAGNSSSVTTAKLAITKSVTGFIIVLIAWVIINVIMVLFGFVDPFGDGSWKIFSC